MKNKKELIDYWDLHKGEFVISSSNIVERFLAIVEDKDDIYYLMYNGKSFILHSILTDNIILKNKINSDDYDKLIKLAKLNHNDQLDKSNNHIKELSDELLKEIYYDEDDERSFFNSTIKLITPIWWIIS